MYLYTHMIYKLEDNIAACCSCWTSKLSAASRGATVQHSKTTTPEGERKYPIARKAVVCLPRFPLFTGWANGCCSGQHFRTSLETKTTLDMGIGEEYNVCLVNVWIVGCWNASLTRVWALWGCGKVSSSCPHPLQDTAVLKMNTYMCVCIYIYIYMYVCAYVYTYTHMNKQTASSPVPQARARTGQLASDCIVCRPRWNKSIIIIISSSSSSSSSNFNVETVEIRIRNRLQALSSVVGVLCQRRDTDPQCVAKLIISTSN